MRHLLAGVIGEVLADEHVDSSPRNQRRLVCSLLRLAVRLGMEANYSLPAFFALVTAQVQREAHTTHPARIIDPQPDRTLN